MPQWCPVCAAATIIGHGKRLRQAHDDVHVGMWIRRGLCRQCNKTFTILPDWLVPFGHYGSATRHRTIGAEYQITMLNRPIEVIIAEGQREEGYWYQLL